MQNNINIIINFLAFKFWIGILTLLEIKKGIKQKITIDDIIRNLFDISFILKGSFDPPGTAVAANMKLLSKINMQYKAGKASNKFKIINSKFLLILKSLKKNNIKKIE